jgi:hypothetical protein
MSNLGVLVAAPLTLVGIAAALKRMEQSAERHRFERRTSGLLP